MEHFIDRLSDDDTENVESLAAANAIEGVSRDAALSTTLESPTSVNLTEVSPTSPTDTDDKTSDEKPTILAKIPTASSTVDGGIKILSKVSSTKSYELPKGSRWALAAPSIDLSGEWELIVTDEFRKQYDRYLERLGQPMLVRSVAVGIVAQTTEETVQFDQGRSLLIVGKNIRGVWTRTLVASGTDSNSLDYVPLKVPIVTADSEKVNAESWWEENGTVHVSWLRGVTKYGGGSFESRRYLEDNGDVLVCESVFHPNDTSKEPNRITWKFRRQQKQ
jgi:hypothetical protein